MAQTVLNNQPQCASNTVTFAIPSAYAKRTVHPNSRKKDSIQQKQGMTGFAVSLYIRVAKKLCTAQNQLVRFTAERAHRLLQSDPREKWPHPAIGEPAESFPDAHNQIW